MSEDISYENEREIGFETERRLALADLAPWLETLSEEELNTPHLAMGKNIFTPRQMREEIEEGTESGRDLVRMLTDHRLELAKRGMLGRREVDEDE